MAGPLHAREASGTKASVVEPNQAARRGFSQGRTQRDEPLAGAVMIEPMSSADAAAITLLVFVPVVLTARLLVRRSRGLPFTSDEALTVVGAIVIALIALALTRSSWAPILLPIGMVGFGVLLVVQTQGKPETGSTVGVGYAAIAIGVLSLILGVVRTTLG